MNETTLAFSMDSKNKQELELDERGCYVASLVDQGGRRYPECVVSGYPVLDGGVEFDRGTKARRTEYNQLLMAVKSKNTAALTDVARFLQRWVGANMDGSYAF